MTAIVQSVRFLYSHSIGQIAYEGPGFRFPVAAARGEGDRIYVANRSYEFRPNGKRISVCTIGEDYVTEFARAAETLNDRADIITDDGTFVWPTSIALDSEWNIYVSDEWTSHISIFTKDGDWIGKWGKAGTRAGELNRPSGLAFDHEDNLFVVDSTNNRVQKFTRDGEFLSKWGTAGKGDGQFNLPWGIDVDKEGHVYVADWRNDRIQKFTPEGEFLMKVGTSGNGEGQFDRPTNVAVDKEGIIYVADWGNDRVQIFEPDGRLITVLTGDATISQWGKTSLDASPIWWKEREVAYDLEREKRFWGPVCVEVDDQGNILVVESARHRIQVYRKMPAVFTGIL